MAETDIKTISRVVTRRVITRMLANIAAQLDKKGVLPVSARLNPELARSFINACPPDSQTQQAVLEDRYDGKDVRVRLRSCWDPQGEFEIELTRLDEIDKFGNSRASDVFESQINRCPSGGSLDKERHLLEKMQQMFINYQQVLWLLRIVLTPDFEKVGSFNFECYTRFLQSDPPMFPLGPKNRLAMIYFHDLSVEKFNRRYLAAAKPGLAGIRMLCDGLISSSLLELALPPKLSSLLHGYLLGEGISCQA